MFTGIIEEIGVIERRESAGTGIKLRIRAPRSAQELNIHDSVSINGVCHTVTWRDDHSFDVESVEETLKKTSIRGLHPGNQVNLELPMRLNERLGGHLVLGHVDATGIVKEIEKREGSWFVWIDLPESFKRYLVRVGSISIDGVSLTIAEMNDDAIAVSIIPYTMEHTIFRWYKKGSIVNIEFDIIGKYLSKLLVISQD